MKRNYVPILLGVLFITPLLLCAQKSISMADAIMKERTILAPANLRQLQWIPGTNQFTHIQDNQLIRVQAGSLATDTLNLLNAINTELKKQGAEALPGFPLLSWTNEKNCWFQTATALYNYQLDGSLSRQNSFPEDAANLDIQEKTFAAAYTRNNGLWITINGKELGVAQSEGPGIVYGEAVHRQEFGIQKGTFWSPSGRYLAFYRMDESMVTEYPIYVLDSMPAQVRNIRYPYAGSTSHRVTVGIYDTETGKKWYLNTGEPADQYLTNISWSPDDQYILIAVLNRDQNHLWLRQYEVGTGELVKTLFEETSDKWVEPLHPAEFVPGSRDQFVWQSERDGYNQLYLYNLSGGRLIRSLSRGNFPVTNFYGFALNGGKCFYQTADETGMNRHLWVTDLKAGVPIRLTEEAGIHSGLFSPTGEWVLDVFSEANTPRTIYSFSVKKPADRKILFSAQNPLADYALGQTQFVQIPSPGGPTLNARMVLPPNFDASKKYPVLVYVYNGPHVQLVNNSWLGAANLWMHHMAQEGCIVFTLDGRGSDNRGLAFENAIFRQAGTAEVEDQLAGVQYLKSQTFVDSTRMGVFGWSYGGFMATSLMSRPEAAGTFRCAVAGGPVIDWRMYEIMYTERYMDAPQDNPEGFEKSSLFSYIDNLSGRLLMIHGSSDNVVLWQHSLRYIRECVRKGKQIDYFVYPEHEHNVRGRDRVHLFEKIDQFFQDNLLHITPRP